MPRLARRATSAAKPATRPVRSAVPHRKSPGESETLKIPNRLVSRRKCRGSARTLFGTCVRRPAPQGSPGVARLPASRASVGGHVSRTCGRITVLGGSCPVSQARRLPTFSLREGTTACDWPSTSGFAYCSCRTPREFPPRCQGFRTTNSTTADGEIQSCGPGVAHGLPSYFPCPALSVEAVRHTLRRLQPSMGPVSKSVSKVASLEARRQYRSTASSRRVRAALPCP